MKRVIAAAALAGLASLLLLAGACGTQKATPTGVTAESKGSLPVSPSAVPSPSPVRALDVCPVDAEICEFARVAEGAIQRGDPYSLITPASKHYSATETVYGIGGAILRQLTASQHPGAVRLVGIACPGVGGSTTCREHFSLVFSGLAKDAIPESPGFGTALVGFRRSPEGPVLLGLSLPGIVDGVVKGGSVSSCGIDVPNGTAGCEVFLYEDTPAPDTSLGFPARATELGTDTTLPRGSAFVTVNCPTDRGRAGCWEVARYQLAGDGRLIKRILYSPDPLVSGLTGVAASPDGRVLMLGLCRGADCNNLTGPKDVSTEFVRSTDGGVTWTPVSSRAGEWWVLGVIGSEALAVRYAGGMSVFTLEPSGALLKRPTGSPLESQPLDVAGTPGWETNAAPALLDAGARSVFTVPFVAPADRALAISGFRSLAGKPSLSTLDVRVGTPLAQTISQYLAIARGFPDAPLGRLYRMSAPGVGEWVTWLSDDSAQLVANVYSDRRPGCVETGSTESRMWPALFDTESGVIRVLSDFLCEGANVRAIAVYDSDGVVNTPGDCLNVRDAPSTSARILACSADGVVLKFLGSASNGWRLVRIPDGTEGYVASAFISEGP